MIVNVNGADLNVEVLGDEGYRIAVRWTARQAARFAAV